MGETRNSAYRRLSRAVVCGLALMVLTGTPAFAQSSDEGLFSAPPLPPSLLEDFGSGRMPDLPDLSNIPRADNDDEDRFVVIHSGHTSGVYYTAAAAICRALSATFDEHRIHCAAERTTGEAENIAALRSGEAQVALVQGDDNYNAAMGDLDLGPTLSVLSLFYESAVVMSRRGLVISAPHDLDGRTVNLGTANAPSRRLWAMLAKAAIAPADDAVVLTQHERPALHRLMCDHKVDALADWIGHPAPYISRTTRHCGANISGVPWTAAVNTLVERIPWLFTTVIPAGTYHGQETPVETVGLRATLVAREDTNPEIVYYITRAILGDVDGFRALSPVFQASSQDTMIHEGNFLPFHEGARRYFEEQGLSTADQPDISG